MFNFNIIKLFIIIFITLNLIGCVKKNDDIIKPEKTLPLNELYRLGYDSFKKGNWNESIEIFNKFERTYSYSEWASNATLMIIYMYFDSGDYIRTLQNIDKFRKLYPDNSKSDYVDYIEGLTFYEQLNVPSKDQTYALKALEVFNSIQKKHKGSIYASESKFKIDLINEQLSGKNMYIARFYISKSLWIPAIKRLKIILRDYNTTIYTIEALHRLVEIYYNLGNEYEAKKYASILGYNFNDSDWYKKSYKIVVGKNYILENKKSKRKLKENIKKLFKFSK